MFLPPFKRLSDKDRLVVITGSIYVVGEALQALQE